MILEIGLSICVALFLLSRIGQPSLLPARARRNKE
jgi:hypothetical protein